MGFVKALLTFICSVLPGATGPVSPSVVDRSGEKPGGWDEDARPSTGICVFAHSRELPFFFFFQSDCQQPCWPLQGWTAWCRFGRPSCLFLFRFIFCIFVNGRLAHKNYMTFWATSHSIIYFRLDFVDKYLVQ